jgi:lipopolysaccharide transport system ATP-binding protein
MEMSFEQKSRGDNEVLVRVEGVSKKFCRSLKKSLWYGVCDIGAELNPFAKHGARGMEHGGRRSEDRGQGSGDRGQGAEALRDGEFWAVNDVSFELRRGECLGLIGHNGAGKTTLLKMLNGLIKPDAGKITMRGRVGALIALGAGFNPILTGRENIYINGSVLGLSKKEIDGKIDEIIDFAEIGEFIDTPVQNYSSGMSVRLGFAVASSLSPDVLILDEVLAVGDIGFVIKCLNRVRRLTANAAVIFVSHNMQLLSSFCSRVIYMQRGCAQLDTINVAEAMERYMSVLAVPDGQSGAGGVLLRSLVPIQQGRHRNEPNCTYEHGDQLAVEAVFAIDAHCEEAYISVSISDMAANDIITAFLVDAEGKKLEFGPGEHSVTIPFGKIELNQGKYSFVFGATGMSSGNILARVGGCAPFQVLSKQSYWTQLIRNIEPVNVRKV